VDAPQKTNLEPKNDDFEKESFVLGDSFSISMLCFFLGGISLDSHDFCFFFLSLESCHHFGIGGKHCMLEASRNFPAWGVSFRPPFTRAHKAVANFARLEFRVAEIWLAVANVSTFTPASCFFGVAFGGHLFDEASTSRLGTTSPF